MSDDGAQRLREGDVVAAADLGSNSFHLAIARCRDGRPQAFDLSRESIQLAAGVDANGQLDHVHRERALATLTRFGQRLKELPPVYVRAVATHAVRRMHDPEAFLQAAEQALGHSVEVISGEQEAGLIWHGVAHALPQSTQKRLVIDVGGGSTELIIGQGLQALHIASVPIGCVGTSLDYFPGGALEPEYWEQAQQGMRKVLQPLAADFHGCGWEQIYGSSGTAHAIAGAARELGLGEGISAATLATLRELLLGCRHVSRINLPGVASDRRSIIAGGVAVMQAVFDVLGIKHMHECDQSLRNGLLWEMVEPFCRPGRANGMNN